MISGELEHVMPPPTGRVFVEMVRKAGDFGEAIAIPNASHFDVVIPTTAAWTIVIRALSREVARAR